VSALLHIASLSEPPLRLLLGTDAYNAAEKHIMQMLVSDRDWKDLSISTDFKYDSRGIDETEAAA
jgi:hypothetical protein